MSRRVAFPALLCVLAAWAPIAMAGAVAAPLDDGRAELVERVYHLSHRQGPEAAEEVCGLLSPRGSVQIRESGRTLVLRDVEPVVERALARLASFDQPLRSLRVAVQIVRAGAEAAPAGESGIPTVELPEDVVARLRTLLRYRQYALLARAELAAREDVESTYEVGSEFRVSFRVDPREQPSRVRMNGFRILRKTADGDLRPLVHTNLSLEIGQPLILGLSNTESADSALMVVLQCDEWGDAAVEARG